MKSEESKFFQRIRSWFKPNNDNSSVGFPYNIIPSYTPGQFFIIIAIIVSSLAYLRHSRTGYFSYPSELRGDMAGYYVYLPAAFIYSFSTENFPKYINRDDVAGGFIIDTVNNKIRTKYTMGTAILQSPVFLAIHLKTIILGRTADGFSGNYHNVPVVAAVIYLLLGLWFLRKYLLYYFPQDITCFVILIILLATNVFYYSVFACGMSHIYSFFTFSAFLYISKRLFSEYPAGYRLFIIWSLLAGLIILIRPINIIFFLVLLMDIQSKRDLKNRMRYLLSLKRLPIAIIIVILLSLPQLAYYKYLTGKIIYYSYQDETFKYWSSPKLLEIWFSARNSAFPYNPVYAVMLVGAAMALFFKQRRVDGIIILVLFLSISYLTAAWHAYHFGCGFGMRNLVEYNALFSIGYGYFLMRIKEISSRAEITMKVFILLFILLNLTLVYNYTICFYGKDWEWSYYLKFL